MRRIILFVVFLIGFYKATSQTFVVDTLIYSGNPNNRINIVIMGDGYTAGQMGQFRTDATAVGNYLLSTPPFDQYANFFNVFGIEVVSIQSGNDHSGTSSDNACGGQPSGFVNNYLETGFDGGGSGGGVHRCIYSSQTGLIFSVANTNFPQYDFVNVIVNTNFYGGCAGGIAFTSLNSASNEIFVHEFGHLFGSLADEYDYGSSTCNAGTTQDINVSQQTDTSLLVWKKWLTNAPIPTPPGTNCSSIGLYEGANYCTTNWYRPKCDCKMMSLGIPFCEICAEQFIYKISTYVNYIESYSPANLNAVVCRNNPQLFSVNILNSLGNTVRTQWFVDNVLVANNSTSYNFDPTPYSNGVHHVKVVAYDTTQLAKKTLTSYQKIWSMNLTDPLTLSTSQTNVTCNGGTNGSASVNVTTGSIPFQYSWTNGGATSSVSNLSAGNYTVTVTAGNGCTKTSSVNITEPSPLTVNIVPSGNTTFCSDDSVTLTATAANSYSWNTGATTHSITVDSAGDYSVTITNAGNCTGISAITHVTVNPLPNSIITPGGATTFCQGGNVTLSASAGASYLWSTNQTSPSIFVSAAGNYSVTVTDANNCSAASAPETITVDNFPVAVINASDTTTFCQGDSVVLSSSPGSSYLWSNGELTQSISVKSSGNYSVSITNSCGTDASIPTAVTVNSLPVIDAGSTQTIFLTHAVVIGGSPTATGNLPFTYYWTPSAGLDSIDIANPIASPVDSTVYFVTVTDANGCLNTDSILVIVNLNVGMDESNMNGNIKVFPSPTNGQIQVVASQIERGEYSFVLRNILGQAVFEEKEIVSGNSLQKQISLIDFPAGIYLLNIENGKSGFVTKVVKLER